MFIFNRRKNQTKIILISVVIIAVGVGILYNLKVDYKFHINENKTVTLDKYIGNGIEVNIPNKIMGIKVTEIGFECFYKNEKIEEVYIPKNIEKIGISAFEGDISLKEIDISSSVKVIGSSAFKKCINLKKITGGENVSEIGTFAFAGDEMLHEIFLLKNVQVLSDGIFKWCEKLEEIQLSDRVEYIGYFTFYGTKIDYSMVPRTTKYVYGNAFEGVDEQSEFVIVGDGVLIRYPYEEVVEIPNGIKVINVQNDSDKMVTKKMILPNTVKSISRFILENSGNAEIYVPESVVEIGEYWNNEFNEGELCDVSKICGIKGSYAEDYAKRYNIPFEEVERWY